MGDRAQVKIAFGEKDIFLYTHWGGEEFPETIRQGLIVGRSRWGDAPYLTRILFCNMVRYEDHDSTTGYGISPEFQDSEYTSLTINTRAQTVIMGDNDPPKVWTFAEYIKEPRKWE